MSRGTAEPSSHAEPRTDAARARRSRRVSWGRRWIASRGRTAGLALWALALLTAPVAGDIGSCGQPIEELDAEKFFTEKQRVDCDQCMACDFVTVTCELACAGAEVPAGFEPGCFPLAQDGEVCLRALRAASCDEYAAYIDDVAPQTPTECNFCPLDQRPTSP